MNQFEKDYVEGTYSNIANHFSSTRYSHWVGVKNYLIQLQKNLTSTSNSTSNLNLTQINFLDFGCGNGKYLSFGKNFNSFAFDNCSQLLNIVSNTYPNVKIIKGDVGDSMENLQNIGLETNFFDSIISIAVIHHLSTEIRRIEMIRNIIQMLKSNGTCLITAWASELVCSDKSDKSDKFDKSDKSNKNNKSKFIQLDTSGDYLISWNNGPKRYYHLFEPNELENLIEKTGLSSQIVVLNKFFECDNWFLEIKKI